MVSRENFRAYERELTSAAKEKCIISKTEVYGSKEGLHWAKDENKIDTVEEFLANFK